MSGDNKYEVRKVNSFPESEDILPDTIYLKKDDKGLDIAVSDNSGTLLARLPTVEEPIEPLMFL